MGVRWSLESTQGEVKTKVGFHPMQFLNHGFTMQCHVQVRRAFTTTALAKLCTLLGKTTTTTKVPFVGSAFPMEQVGQHPNKLEFTLSEQGI